MGQTVLVTPDVGFIRQVIAGGGGDVKKCFQCATCSAACDLAPRERPFPRQQILHAQWGLRDRLLADQAVWLCHGCGECTARCPRGARPADVLAAVRRTLIGSLAFPSFMGAAGASASGLAWVALAGMMVFAVMATLAPGAPPGGPYEFAHVFPIGWLEALFFALSAAVLIALGVGVRRLVTGFASAGLRPPGLPELLGTAAAIARHDRFAECRSGGAKRWGHLLTFWGFVVLATAGTIVGIGSLTGVMHTPLPLSHPLKVLANAGGVLLFAGTGVLLADRLARAEVRQHSTAFDWAPLVLLFGIAATGLVAEALRVMQVAPAMYAVYFVHLVLIFVLFVGAAYTKLAHAAYRTVALAYSSSVDHSRGVS